MDLPFCTALNSSSLVISTPLSTEVFNPRSMESCLSLPLVNCIPHLQWEVARRGRLSPFQPTGSNSARALAVLYPDASCHDLYLLPSIFSCYIFLSIYSMKCSQYSPLIAFLTCQLILAISCNTFLVGSSIPASVQFLMS